MCLGAGLLSAWDDLDRRRILREVLSEDMGMTVLPDGTKVFDLFQEPLRDEYDRCSGTVVALSILAGTPFVRLRSALPKALLSGDLGEVLGRRNGLSAQQAKRLKAKEEALVASLYGGGGERYGGGKGKAGPCSGLCVDRTEEIKLQAEARKRRAARRRELLTGIFESTRAQAAEAAEWEDDVPEDDAEAEAAALAAADTYPGEPGLRGYLGELGTSHDEAVVLLPPAGTPDSGVDDDGPPLSPSAPVRRASLKSIAEKQQRDVEEEARRGEGSSHAGRSGRRRSQMSSDADSQRGGRYSPSNPKGPAGGRAVVEGYGQSELGELAASDVMLQEAEEQGDDAVTSSLTVRGVAGAGEAEAQQPGPPHRWLSTTRERMSPSFRGTRKGQLRLAAGDIWPPSDAPSGGGPEAEEAGEEAAHSDLSARATPQSGGGNASRCRPRGRS